MESLQFLCAQQTMDNIDKLCDNLISLHDNNLNELSSVHDRQLIQLIKNIFEIYKYKKKRIYFIMGKK
jgi:hypothetical protein